MIWKTTAVWLGIALTETVHGILRTIFLTPRIGDRRGRQVAVFTGSVLIFAISWLTIPWLGPASPADCVQIGVIWLGLMLTFDIGLGRLVMKMPWWRIFADFNPFEGGFLGFGMAFLTIAPWLAARVRGLI